VSVSNNVLVIDAGNTSVKWTAFENDSIVWNKRELHLESRSTLLGDSEYTSFQPDRLYFASVRGEADSQVLLAVVKAFYPNVEIYPLRSRKEACGVTNPYVEPERLGIDRWLNVLAISELLSGGIVVVDVGTALKVEFIEKNGQYKGGYIVPGFEMMVDALVVNTGKIRIDSSDLYDSQGLIDNTGLAVHIGCWQMLLALVERVYRQNLEKSFVFTGGNGLKIMQELQIKGNYHANLVALGAKRLGDELVGQK